MSRVCLLCVCLGAGVCAAEQEAWVEARALFRDRALLRIDGRDQMLKVGERSAEGVLLVSASPKSAVIELGGRRRILDLSRHISAGYQEVERQSVAVQRNARGEYRVTGSVNGRRVEFLLDTGANIVAFSADQARQLGIDYKRLGERSSATTASGVVDTWVLQLPSIEVGGIVARQVPVSVLDGPYPQTALLGMSWLRSVEMREQNGVLYLHARN